LPSTLSSAPPEAQPDEPPPRRGRWILAAIAVVVVLAIGAVTWVVVAGNDDGDGSSAAVVPHGLKAGGPRAGDVAPDFTLQTLDGKTVSLSDYRGKPVVLNFWASWCNPCREEFPLFRKQLAAHPGDYVMLGVDYHNDIPSDAKHFAKEQRATWPTVVDADNAVGTAYGVRAVPQTFFIDRDGKVVQRFYAPVTDDEFPHELTKITAPSGS
jgi:cytochrome c biogenesis protein CcmG/thiol:disulfide interchange protein DsbE